MVIAVVALAVVVSVLIAAGSAGVYDNVGRGGFDLESDAPTPTEGGGSALRDEEIRQMVEARNARRMARGEAPVDVEDEIRRLTPAPAADAGLREEVRQLVIARNARRAARGQEPLDIDAETERRLREL